MTQVKGLLVVSVVCTTMALGGCSEEPKPADADDVKREARELAETLKSYSAEQKREAMAEAEEAVAEINAEVDHLKARISERWGEMDEAARRNAEESLEELEDEQADLSVRFQALRDASGDAWAKVSDGFSEAYAELREAWQEAEQELSE